MKNALTQIQTRHMHMDSNYDPSRGRNDFVEIETTSGNLQLQVAEILRLEATIGMTKVYLQNGTAKAAFQPLKYFIDHLDDQQFFQVHRAHIININCVGNILASDTSYLEMVNKDQVPIARRRKKELIGIIKK